MQKHTAFLHRQGFIAKFTAGHKTLNLIYNVRALDQFGSLPPATTSRIFWPVPVTKLKVGPSVFLSQAFSTFFPSVYELPDRAT
jgi:hypothetical protein